MSKAYFFYLKFIDFSHFIFEIFSPWTIQGIKIIMKSVVNHSSQCQSILALIIFIAMIRSCHSLCGVPKCAACVLLNDTACQTCSANYSLVGVSCCKNTLQNCRACMTNGDQCDSCTSQNFCLATSCVACSTFLTSCVTCSSCSFCLTCTPNTLAASAAGQCQPCTTLMSFCQTCSDRNSCLSCISNSYGIKSATKKCELCSALLSHCTNCNSETECLSCSGAPLIVLNNSRCVGCGNVLPNCINCTAPDFCTLCSSYYSANLTTYTTSFCALCRQLMYGCQNCSSTKVCVRCSMGRIVTNGCSDSAGCIAVIQRPSMTPYCVMCDLMEFHAVPVNGTCTCIRGFVVGQYCTEILGCASILRNSSGDHCTSCHTKGNYYLENGTCHCQPAFWQDGPHCKEVCGDGKLYVLPCDDGNVIDGDGCSSSCKVESGYYCKDGINHTMSTCIYTGKINAKIFCIYKIQSMNAFKIIIKFTPFISHLRLINFNNFVTFNFSKNCSVSSIIMAGNFLEVMVNYQEDVEESNATIMVQYNPAYIVSAESVIQTQISDCNGDKLTYDPNVQSSFKQTIVLLTKIISLIVLVVWLVGSYSHKMIGVQTIHTIHLIFIMQAFAPRYRPAVYYFNGLSNSMNFFQELLLSSTYLSSASYQRLNYSSDFMYNFGIVAGIQILSLVVFGSLWFINKMSKKSWEEEQHRQQNIPKIKKCQEIMYDLLLFPAFIGFFFSFMISLQVNSISSVERLKSTYSLAATAILVIMMTTFIVFFEEWKKCSIISEQRDSVDHRPSYIVYYLTYILILSYVILLSLNKYIPVPLFAFAGITILYFFFLILYRPYKDKVHNIGILINQIGVLVNLAWLISQDYINLSRSIDETIAFSLMGWIFLIILWAVVRLVFEIKKSRSPHKNKKKKPKKQPIQSYQQYQQQIVKAINAQKNKNMNCYNLTVQLIHSREDDYNMRFYDNKENFYGQELRKKLRQRIDEKIDLFGKNKAFSQKSDQ